MDLLLCWLVGPVVLVAVAVGLCFGVELISGARLPWTVRPALGLAVMIVIAQLGVSIDTTAELAIPVVVALGAFGLVMGWSARLTRVPLPGWELAAALGVYLVFGAPVLLSGDPTLAGFIKLDDTATWMALDRPRLRVRPQGRRLRALHLGGADRRQRTAIRSARSRRWR